MRNVFPLETVLRVRPHNEDTQARALAGLGIERQKLDSMLARVRKELQQWASARYRDIGSVATGTVQHSMYARLSLLKSTEEQVLAQLASLEIRRRELQSRFLAARSGREMLTELKQQKQAMHALADQRREQRQLEDLLLGRWSL